MSFWYRYLEAPWGDHLDLLTVEGAKTKTVSEVIQFKRKLEEVTEIRWQLLCLR